MNGHRIGWGWTACDDSWLSRSIRYLTRPSWALDDRAEWSHMFLVFALDGVPMIHEALGSRGWSKRPLADVYAWAAADPERRRIRIEWLPVSGPGQIDEIYHESCAWLGTRSYAWQQIAYFGMAETLAGRGLRRLVPGLFNRDVADDRVICSEGACRLVGERVRALDLREPGEPWAMICPQAAFDRYMRRIP